ncbi:MAG: hypothetical protein WAT71_15880, partial [Ignavibacteria bacterium]
MKHCYLLVLFTMSINIDLFSQNLLTEDFIFSPADSLENLGNWNRSGLNTEFNIKVVSPGLDYTGYVGS